MMWSSSTARVSRTDPSTARLSNPQRPSVLVVALALCFCVACVDVPQGDELYVAHCAECHGSEGLGDPQRNDFYPGLDLQGSALVRGGRSGPVYRILRQGFGAMPGFDHKLEHDELAALTEHVLEIGRRAEAEAPAANP